MQVTYLINTITTRVLLFGGDRTEVRHAPHISRVGRQARDVPAYPGKFCDEGGQRDASVKLEVPTHPKGWWVAIAIRLRRLVLQPHIYVGVPEITPTACANKTIHEGRPLPSVDLRNAE